MSARCRCEPCPDCGFKHYCNVAVDHVAPYRTGDCPAAERRSCTAMWSSGGGMNRHGCVLFKDHDGEHVCVCGPQSGTCSEVAGRVGGEKEREGR